MHIIKRTNKLTKVKSYFCGGDNWSENLSDAFDFITRKAANDYMCANFNRSSLYFYEVKFIGG